MSLRQANYYSHGCYYPGRWDRAAAQHEYNLTASTNFGKQNHDGLMTQGRQVAGQRSCRDERNFFDVSQRALASLKSARAS
jgi:hypothetical protein